MPQLKYLEAGQIVGTHGVRGEVRVQPWCDSPQQFATFKKLYWDAAGKQPVKVKGRPHKNIALVTLDGAVYQMLSTPKDIGNSLLGESLCDVTLFDEQLAVSHCSCCVFARNLLVLIRHQSPQLSRLSVIVAVIFPFIIIENRTSVKDRFLQPRRILPFTETVGLIRYCPASVVISTHLAVSMV